MRTYIMFETHARTCFSQRIRLVSYVETCSRSLHFVKKNVLCFSLRICVLVFLVSVRLRRNIIYVQLKYVRRAWKRVIEKNTTRQQHPYKYNKHGTHTHNNTYTAIFNLVRTQYDTLSFSYVIFVTRQVLNLNTYRN